MAHRHNLTLELATPTGRIVDNVEVAGVEIPGLLGEIGILPDHEPFCGPVAEGVVRFVEDGADRRIAVGRGFYEVDDHGLVRVLVDRACDAADVDAASVRSALADLAGERGEGAARDEAYLRAQLRAAGAAGGD
ncbi:MAG: F0F1 ATP synthase subunit epsilon [Deltaproteobacteria bacterium]|nr:MAG: F0F1 ATP synthase subunit epsilon [Deltaproteobacteria bacterium]